MLGIFRATLQFCWMTLLVVGWLWLIWQIDVFLFCLIVICGLLYAGMAIMQDRVDAADDSGEQPASPPPVRAKPNLRVVK